MKGEAGECLANIISIHDIHDHLSNQIAANLELVNFIHDLVVHTCGCANAMCTNLCVGALTAQSSSVQYS